VKEMKPILSGRKIIREYIRNGRGSNIFEAVKETDVDIYSGKLVLIKGRSGGGKTTLLSMLAGILEPSKGEVVFEEKNIYEQDEEQLANFRNAHFGYIPQGQSAIGSLTVLENVLLPYTLMGEEENKELKDRAMELLISLGIGDLADILPQELSGGELRRMAIARALIKKPEVIFADEPTGDLDDENTLYVLKLLREAADKGAAVVIVTHDQGVENYADSVYYMDGGILNKEIFDTISHIC